MLYASTAPFNSTIRARQLVLTAGVVISNSQPSSLPRLLRCFWQNFHTTTSTDRRKKKRNHPKTIAEHEGRTIPSPSGRNTSQKKAKGLGAATLETFSHLLTVCDPTTPLPIAGFFRTVETRRYHRCATRELSLVCRICWQMGGYMASRVLSMYRRTFQSTPRTMCKVFKKIHCSAAF